MEDNNQKDLSFLEEIAKNHALLINIVKSLGCEPTIAEDIVQEGYIVLAKYGTPEKALNKNGTMNRGYVFITLRNLYYQYFNASKKVTKLNLDDVYHLESDEGTIKEQEAFNELLEKIDETTSELSWYDKKMFDIYMTTGKSIRTIAAESKISVTSIFTTLKNVKNIIRDKNKDDYNNYLDSRDN